jgi:GT2 family glycosyltransferase
MGGIFDPYSGKKILIGSETEDKGKYNAMIECDWLPGMGTITHRSVYEKVGMLDSVNFPQYHGDSDFTFRAKKMGYRIIVHPDLQIYNDTRHSGLKHDESIKRLFESLFSIRSNFNIKKDFKYYRKHSKSWKAYSVPISKYFKYIGGFFKWKILGILGLKRKNKPWK